MNHSTTRFAIATIAACLFAASATASTVTLTPAQAGPSVQANTSTGAPGFGSSSFQESGNAKGEIYITAASLFGTGSTVTFGDIASISYWTNKTPGSSSVPNTSPDVDWSLYIYTQTTGTGDTGSFYHSRLTAEPLYSNGAYQSGVWRQWATDDASAPLRFYDQARDGNIQGTNTDPTLADLQNGGGSYMFTGANAGPGAVANNYNGELIKYLSLQTGSLWAAGFTGLVDGLTVTLKNGLVASVDLSATAAAAVPEPESMALIFAGLAGLLAVSRRRRRA